MDQDNRRRIDHPRTYGRSRAVRWHRYNYKDPAVIHLTICANQGEPFNDQQLAQVVCDSVEKSCEMLRYELFGYCLMPDHLHAVLSPADSGTEVSRWLNSFKSFTTNQYQRICDLAVLWQQSANDHVCRDGETAETVMRYVADNPVRRGLVEDWRDWPWTKVFVDI